MIQLRTTCPAETAALAAAVARLVVPGDLLVLSGDLGAGKTAFVKGFGAELEVADAITSPTFTLVREYEGRLRRPDGIGGAVADGGERAVRIYHLDVYRLAQIEEALDLGLSELLDDDAVTLIEWGESILPALPSDYLEVRLELGEGDDDRIVHLATIGASWSARTRLLRESVATWS